MALNFTNMSFSADKNVENLYEVDIHDICRDLLPVAYLKRQWIYS